MQHSRIAFTLLLLLTAILPVRAQLYTHFQRFTEKDGYRLFATNGYITQDRDGLLWIGGDNGLLAFDGVHFKNYKRRKGDSAGLPSNAVAFNFQDREGLHWVHVRQHGLFWFEPQSGTFRPVRYGNQKTFDINKHRFERPYETRNGDLWFTLPGYGLARWNRKRREMVPYPVCPATGCDPEDRTYWMGSLTEDPDDGSLWLTSNTGLIQFFPTTGRLHVYANEQAGITTTSVCFFWDEDKTLWMGTWGRGLNRFDRRTKAFTAYTWWPKYAGTRNICAGIGRVDDNRLWLATLDNGQLVFDKRSGTFERVLGTDNNQLTGNAFYQNANGVIWLASLQSLIRVHLVENRFSFLPLAHLQTSKPDAHLFNSFVKVDSVLYTGMFYYGDLVAVNERTGTATALPHPTFPVCATCRGTATATFGWPPVPACLFTTRGASGSPHRFVACWIRCG